MRAQRDNFRLKQIQNEYNLVDAELATKPIAERTKELLNKAKTLGIEKSRLEGKWD